MKIRYKGGRNRLAVTFNRQSYHFGAENDKVLDIKDQKVINYIFTLTNRSEFEAVVEPEEIKFNPENNTVNSNSVEVKIEVKKPIGKNKAKKGKK